jgi:acyl carrier protein phosphodiesterase
MNYLAHAVLSFDQPDVLFGNMIGDFVKGNAHQNFREGIQKGILLHRKIDHFTDQHPEVKKAQQLLKPEYRLSSGVFVDIFFDFYLANDVQYFDENSLPVFTQHVYQHLHANTELMNERMQNFFGYMKEYDWLLGYRYKEGIEKSVRGICKRYPRIGDPDIALERFETCHEEFLHHYTIFFPELVQFVRDEIIKL